jgi:hypothetical protein
MWTRDVCDSETALQSSFEHEPPTSHRLKPALTTIGGQPGISASSDREAVDRAGWSTDKLRDGRSSAPVGKELSRTGVPDEAKQTRLTWPERFWVYNVLLFVLLYAAAAATCAVLAGPRGFSDKTFSPLATLTVLFPIAAEFHLLSWFMDMSLNQRRAAAVLSRPLRHGHNVWAVPVGDSVRVYRVKPERTLAPHLWPLLLGRRGSVDGGREFSAEHEAEAAYDYAAELDQASRPDTSAVAVAQVINERPIRSA